MEQLYELTNPQKNILSIEKSSELNSKMNNIFTVFELKGLLNDILLKETINQIIKKNDALRINIIEKDNKTFQTIKAYSYYDIEVVDIKKEKSNIDSFIEEKQKEQISIYDNNLFKFTIIFSEKSTYISFNVHHIIADAWGSIQVAEQVKEIYGVLERKENIEKITKNSYIDFIKKEEDYKLSNKYENDKNYWNNYVSDISSIKIFENREIFNKKAKRIKKEIDVNLFNSITEYCKKNSISEYTFLLGVISSYYSKINGISKLTIGTPFLNRQKKYGELETVGMFVSTLPINIAIKENESFIDLCKNIWSTNLSCYKHSKFSYLDIKEMYNKQSGTNSNLYEITFSYHISKLTNKLNDDEGICDWLFSGEQSNSLTINFVDFDNKKLFYYDYLLSCMNENDIENTHQRLLVMIKQILEDDQINISKIDILSKKDISILKDFNNTGNIKLQDESIITVFNNVVQKYKDDIAIKCGNKTITYEELNKKVNILAYKLKEIGVSKNTPVVLFQEKNIDTIISIFAVLKAGGCYVPILPEESKARILYIINDCKPVCILTNKKFSQRLNLEIKCINVEEVLNNKESLPNNYNNSSNLDLAYIIYTSGTTGNPKGTMLTHQNVISLMRSMEKDEILKPIKTDVSMSLLKYSFDASGIDIYSSILVGGKLIIIQKEKELNPIKVLKIMQDEKVTRSFLIPKWIENIAMYYEKEKFDLSNLKILGTGGEVLKPQILKNLLNDYKNLKILNLYGPTEATMFVTYKEVLNKNIESNYIEIGKPIPCSRLIIVNKNNSIMPIGAKGELVIYEDKNSIRNLAKGYLNLDDLNNEKFQKIYNTIIKEDITIYKTGDIASINESGEIDFFGRTDDMVKVNGGYLVSINEVEKRAIDIIGERYKVCAVASNFKNTKSIFLFVVNEYEEELFTFDELKEKINTNISFFMRPKKIIELKSFPYNSNGKIDRKKLANMVNTIVIETEKEMIKPTTKTEIQLYDIIKNETGIEHFSITDDFDSDLGFDSLTITMLHISLEKYNISIQDLYNHSNIKRLAKLIDSNEANVEQKQVLQYENLKIVNNSTTFDLSKILLTGTTGFLGIHILYELLYRTKTNKIYCIIRRKDGENSIQRLKNTIKYYFRFDIEINKLIDEKVVIIDGDITKEKLGLSKKQYNEIQREVTCVINCMANVKHFGKYKRFYKDNAESVINLLNFCQGDVSLAHMSTMSVAGFKEDITKNVVYDEDCFDIGQNFNNNPYLVSKFEAERILIESSKQNIKIFRLGNIMPRQSDGLFQKNFKENAFLNAIKLFYKVRSVPDIRKDNIKVEFSQVDECAKSIMSILESKSERKIYHIVNHNTLSLNEFKNLFENGLEDKINRIPLNEFIDKIDQYKEIGTEYIRNYLLDNKLNDYSCEKTVNILDFENFKWSKIDDKYIRNIVKLIEEKGN